VAHEAREQALAKRIAKELRWLGDRLTALRLEPVD